MHLHKISQGVVHAKRYKIQGYGQELAVMVGWTKFLAQFLVMTIHVYCVSPSQLHHNQHKIHPAEHAFCMEPHRFFQFGCFCVDIYITSFCKNQLVVQDLILSTGCS